MWNKESGKIWALGALMWLGLAAICPAQAQDSGLQTFFLQPAAGNQPLTTSWAAVNGVSLTYTVTEPSLVTVMGHIGVENMNTSDADSNSMIATRLVNEAGQQIAGSFHTTNVDRTRHYEDMIVMAQYQVTSGQHQIVAQAYKRNFPPPDDNVNYVIKSPEYSGVFVRVESLPSTGCSYSKQK